MNIDPGLRQVRMHRVVTRPGEARASAAEHTEPALAGGDVMHVTVEHRDRQRCLGNEQTKILVHAAEVLVGTLELLGALRDAALQV